MDGCLGRGCGQEQQVGGWTHARPSGQLSVRMLCVREQRAEAPGTHGPESKAGSSQVSGVRAVLGTLQLSVLGPSSSLA